jgi:prolyl 4-hydroxylase
MNQQEKLARPGDDFFWALGRAAYGFMALEWAVIWLSEALTPAKPSLANPLAGTPLAQHLEDAVAQAIVAGRELPEELVPFANQFAELAQRHGRMVSGHPNSGMQDTPQLLFSARTGRLEWKFEDVLAAAEEFESATQTALLLIEGLDGSAGAEPDLAEPVAPEPRPSASPEERRGRARADAAAQARSRLAADPRVKKLQARSLEIYTIDNLLDPSECATLIDLIERDLYPSGLLAAAPDPSFRTSMSCNLNRQDPAVAELERRICGLLGADPRHGETAQGQRYQVGQEFKPHHDFFHPGQFYTEQAEREGGQRTWTAMLFLNEPEAGGCTNFPDAAVKVAPEAGRLVVWNNLDAAGNPNTFSLHQGMPVEAGSKYVITKWFRERVWEPGAAAGSREPGSAAPE